MPTIWYIKATYEVATNAKRYDSPLLLCSEPISIQYDADAMQFSMI